MYSPEHAPLSSDSINLSHNVLLKQETPAGMAAIYSTVWRLLRQPTAPHAISTLTVSRGVSWPALGTANYDVLIPAKCMLTGRQTCPNTLITWLLYVYENGRGCRMMVILINQYRPFVENVVLVGQFLLGFLSTFVHHQYERVCGIETVLHMDNMIYW